MSYDQADQSARVPLVDTIIDNLDLTLEWLDITTLAPFKARITGTLQEADLPSDASISFPKPLRVVWNNLEIGHVDVKTTFGVAPQDDKHTDNVLLTPASDDLMAGFIQALLKEKLVSIELQAEEVTVRAEKEDHVGASFRKATTVQGFDGLKDLITLGNIKFTGSEEKGNCLTGYIDVVIKNPSGISVLVDGLPIDLYYKGGKVADLIVPGPFKLLHTSAATEFRATVSTNFRSNDARDTQCKEFVADYITTPEKLELSLHMDKTTIKLASSILAVPPFKLTCAVNGLNKKFVADVTAYVSFLRAPLLRKFDFTIDFENPIDAPITITLVKGEASMKTWQLCGFHENLEMTIPANKRMTSRKIRKAALRLTLSQLMTFVGKTEVKVEVDVEHVNASIGTFVLPSLAFNNLTDIRTKLKWSL